MRSYSGTGWGLPGALVHDWSESPHTSVCQGGRDPTGPAAKAVGKAGDRSQGSW